MHVTLLIMLIGSAICTGAPTDAYGVLLLGRGVQGVGAAGVQIAVRTILADRVSLKDYALNWTLFALLSGVSFSIGPVLGGYLTQASWRWCFGINLPVAVLAMILVVILLRKELLGPQPLVQVEGAQRDFSSRRARFAARVGTIDFGGQLLFLWGMGLLILAFTWAGGTYSWNSANVLAPLVIGAVLSVAWVVYEFLMTPGKLMSKVFPTQTAMIPWEVLSQRDIGLLFIINFAVGMAMFAVMYFMDLYFALVLGNSPSKAGIALLYFLPGLGGTVGDSPRPLYTLPRRTELTNCTVGGYMAMFGSNVWPRQTLPSLLLGSITTAVGITVLAYAINAENTNLVYGMMALTGHGVGMRLNPGSLHGLAYFPTKTAAITCIVSFAGPFGGTVGLTLMSTVFNNKSGPLHTEVKDGIRWAFIAIIPFMWACVILTMFLGNVWLLKNGDHEVVHGSYLWSFITRKKLPRETRTRGDIRKPAHGGVKDEEKAADPDSAPTGVV